MHKVLYILDDDIKGTTGVAFKIRQQTKYWPAMNVEPYFYCVSQCTLFDKDLNILEQKNRATTSGKFGFVLSQYQGTKHLYQLSHKYKWDLIYSREVLPTYYLSKIYKSHKVVVEVNGSSRQEGRKKYLLSLYNLFHKLFPLNIDAFVFVSHELKKERKVLKKSIVLGNGIEVQKFTYKEVKDISFLFILTHNHSWQGLDKLREIARNLKEFQFYIIGYEDLSEENLNFLGKMDSNQVDEFIIKHQPVGISSLALHRKNMFEASTLKSRHYLKYSLPVIFSYNDTDITKENGLFLHLDNDENVSSQKNCDLIRDYVDRVHNNIKHRQDIHEFVSSMIDNTEKEKIRINFLKKLL